jgi:DNA-binding helix-hairpin-helix protein with protein kinase domain
MNAKVKPQVRDRGGHVPLGEELGRGGEGSVYEVVNRSDVVAKVYHKPIAAEKAAKIEAMATMKTDRLLSLTAWPVELLHTPGGDPCGLLMPKVSGHKDIHHLYSPKSRKVEFPNADWRFLIRAAANTARAFAVIHDAGCVIGDVNHGGVTVSDKATVKLIDCDSFQVSACGQKFLCEVGVPDFTPPELQGKSFKGVVRSPNHDNFGLAVLMFRLLFMGRHPFAGRFLGPGDMPIEKAITEFRFPYGSGRALVQMEPPPNTPEIASASMPITLLLERAFARASVNGSRPTASEWITALERLEKQLKQCHINASHHYVNGLQSCPWCRVEAATGVVLFNVYVYHQGGGIGSFDIAVAWSRIASVQPPGSAPVLVDKQGLGALRPCQEAVDAGGNPFMRKLGVALVIAAVIGLCVVFPAAWILWLGGGFFVGKAVGSKATNSQAVANFIAKHQAAESEYRTIKYRWDRDATDQRFAAKLRELEGYRSQWREVPNVRQRRYRELEQEREKAQLKRFLEQYTIDRAKIPGIGPGRKSMLESYNVETAWDVTDRDVSRVPGFGPALTCKLKEWRRSVEQRFRYDPSKGVDPRDIAALDREMVELKRKLEQHLIAGPTELTQITNQIMAQRNALERQVDDAYQAMAQAEVDMNAAKA